jgi:hypothetical protein
MDKQHQNNIENNDHTDDLDLDIQELEDRFTPDVHGICVCSSTCDCTSCSCVVVF